MNLPDPPIHEAGDAATATATHTEANDVIMAKATPQPKATLHIEANEATEDVQSSTSDVAAAPPVPHTMMTAFNREGELINVMWPILTPPEAPGPQYDY